MDATKARYDVPGQKEKKNKKKKRVDDLLWL